jgi:hypothetical protein
MGLDTTHGCWHESYSAFSRWREQLADAAGLPELMTMQGANSDDGSIGQSWEPYSNDALTVLLCHSDCDSAIPHAECARLANRLEELLPKLGGEVARWTRQFIDGLRRADAAGEAVDFH